MEAKTVGDINYYTNEDGLILFSLKRGADFIEVREEYGRKFEPIVWKFFDRNLAEAWIKEQIDRDTRVVAQKLKDLERQEKAFTLKLEDKG